MRSPHQRMPSDHHRSARTDASGLAYGPCQSLLTGLCGPAYVPDMAAPPAAPSGRPGGCSSGRHAEPRAHRLFTCGHCGETVLICSCCDRGQRYCGPACRKQARVEQVRMAGRHYQRTEGGRLQHAARQRAYCKRQGRAAQRPQQAPNAAATDLQVRRPVGAQPIQGERRCNPVRPGQPHRLRCVLCGCPCNWVRREPRPRSRRKSRAP